MRLLFDQNLSRALVRRLADLFPDSAHVGYEISRIERRVGAHVVEEVPLW